LKGAGIRPEDKDPWTRLGLCREGIGGDLQDILRSARVATALIKVIDISNWSLGDQERRHKMVEAIKEAADQCREDLTKGRKPLKSKEWLPKFGEVDEDCIKAIEDGLGWKGTMIWGTQLSCVQDDFSDKLQSKCWEKWQTEAFLKKVIGNPEAWKELGGMQSAFGHQSQPTLAGYLSACTNNPRRK